MRLTIAKKEDAYNWNKLIHRDSESLFFDRFEWNQALGHAFDNITPLPLIIKENRNIISVFPACINKYKFYSTIESLPFSD